MPDPKLFTTSQAAERLGVSVVTINKWIDRGYLPHAYKLSQGAKSPYRIPEADIEVLEEQRKAEQREHSAA